MLHKSEVRVQCRENTFLYFSVLQNFYIFGNHTVYTLNGGKKISLGSLPNVDTMGLDICSKKWYSFREVLKIYLPRMETEFQLFRQKRPNIFNRPLEILTILVNEDEVIDISSVMVYLQFLLYECIEVMEIEIYENLTREVANRKTDTGSGEKQALRPWETNPVLSSPLYDTVGRRVVLYHLFTKPEELFMVVSGIFRIDGSLNLTKEDAPVDIHEESLDIELEDVRISRIVFACLSDKSIDTMNTEQSPLSLATAIGIVNE